MSTETRVSSNPLWSDWIWQQSQAVRCFSDLKKHLPWIPEGLEETTKNFQFQVTPYYLSLLNPQDSQDPLAQIVVPRFEELQWHPEELQDPIGDWAPHASQPRNPAPGIVHRYPDRCLLLLTPLCSSYCRYCFRREIVSHPENVFSAGDIEKSLQYIENTPHLREVVFSGGDPLLLGDDKIEKILRRLSQVPHLRVLRLHSRFPIFNPFRITNKFANRLSQIQKPVVMMIHTMHPRELTPELGVALNRLKKAGVTLLNQSVLVKGCNDNAEVLKELSYRLAEWGVVNQYLHVMDLARGTSHFRVPLENAQKILSQLRGQLSGYMIPQLTLDIPGGFGKINIETSSIQKLGEEQGRAVYQIQSPLDPQQTLTYKDIY